MENKSKLNTRRTKKAIVAPGNNTRKLPKPSGGQKKNHIQSKPLTTGTLELKKQKVKEAFSLARFILCCGVVVSLTIVLVSKDSNLILEVLKIFGGGGIGYGIGKHLPK